MNVSSLYISERNDWSALSSFANACCTSARESVVADCRCSGNVTIRANDATTATAMPTARNLWDGFLAHPVAERTFRSMSSNIPSGTLYGIRLPMPGIFIFLSIVFFQIVADLYFCVVPVGLCPIGSSVCDFGDLAETQLVIVPEIERQPLFPGK